MSISTLLDDLYIKYDINNLGFGIVGDKLGDLYEEFIVIILQDSNLCRCFNAGESLPSIEFGIFRKILRSCGLPQNSSIAKIDATSTVMHRVTGGLSKTDVIITVHFDDGFSCRYPISVKQSTVSKVAFAEFDVDTIVAEVGISDPYLIRLLEKHQVDKSAKHFTAQERCDLKRLIEPIAKEFVRWVITGSPDVSNDIRIPICLVKFQVAKKAQHYKYLDYGVYDVDEYVKHIMLGKNGEIKVGGFGTGLSWTYATGSGGKKIQFKG